MIPTGLSSEQALEKLSNDGPNRLPSARPKSIWTQLLEVLSEPMLLLLLAAGGITFAIGEMLEASVLMASVIFVISISLYQTRRSDRALEALRSLTVPRALVIRDGMQVSVSNEELVMGDLVLLREGDRVPADANLIQVTNLAVDESSLTGESFPIDKQVGQQAFSGTLVVRGHARALITATGINSEIGKIGKMLVAPKATRSKLQQEIDRIVRVVAVVSLIAASTVVLVYGITRGDFLEGALAGIAASMALLPEELPIILTVFFGLGAWRMSKAKVIVRSSPAIETLGSVSVVCVDKTGTLTMNEMVLVAQNEDVARYGLLASPQDAADPMDKAFHVASDLPDSYELVREYSLSDEHLYLAMAWKTNTTSIQIAAKGAPEAILELCDVSAVQRQAIMSEVEAAASKGQRILGVAKTQQDSGKNLPADVSQLKFEFVGLAFLNDPVRPGVPDAIKQMHSAGIRVVMITGDYPATAVAIAKEIGMTNSEKFITGSQFDQLSPKEKQQCLDSANIFSRMLPHQKLELVKLLQSSGEVVAMTGDGVNDAPALKSADVGIAMGTRGSEVAREAAAIVISDDSFTSIAEGVLQGRRIFANLRKAAAYVIAIHIPIFGMALLPIFTPVWPLILLPVQIAILELIIDPTASMAYEAEPASKKIMSRKPRPISERLIGKSVLQPAAIQGILLFFGTAIVYFIGLNQDLDDAQIRSQSFATILLGNLLLLLTNRSTGQSIFQVLRNRPNKISMIIFGAGILTMVAIYSFQALGNLFAIESISPIDWFLVITCASLGMLWNEGYKVLKRKLSQAPFGN